MAITNNKDQQIFFEDIGSGMPVVLGHSFLCTGEMWREQTTALGHKYRFINPDFRGHGRSGPVAGPFSLYDAVGDVVAVLDALEIERAVWCGLSIGGMVAMRAALEVPDRVSALVIMDSDAGAERTLRKLRYGLMGAGARAMGIGPFLPTVCRLMFGATTRRTNPGLVDEWRGIFADVDIQSTLRCLGALVDRDSVLLRLSEISVPTLVVVGQEDESLPVPVSQRIHEGLPHSQFAEIREAGHLSALEQPEQVNEVLDRFLQDLTTDTPDA
jgi:pimeloyl-ACP methyl ester carboxylesterase